MANDATAPAATEPAIDRYTVAHAGAGALLAAYDMPWWAALGLAIVWSEIGDHPAKRAVMTLPPTVPGRDAATHGVGDIVAVMLGFLATRAVPTHDGTTG